MPGISFPSSLHVEEDLKKAVKSSRNILVVVPSHAFADILNQIKPWLNEESRIAWATKGLDHETGRLLQDVATEVLGDNIPLAVLSGPTFAKEMAAGLPTAISLASLDEEFTQDHYLLYYIVRKPLGFTPTKILQVFNLVVPLKM